MIYHPISTLILAGVRRIKIVSTISAIPQFQSLIGDGRAFGIEINYSQQDSPLGIVDAIRAGIVGEDLSQGICVILGDNIFFGSGMGRGLSEFFERGRAKIFLKEVIDPSHFGVAELDHDGFIRALKEKPTSSSSNYAVTGMYYFPSDLSNMCAAVIKSERNEFEVISLLNGYLDDSRLDYHLLGRGTYWADAGSTESLLEISTLIKLLQSQPGMLVGSPEEAGFQMGNISELQFLDLISRMPTSSYKGSLMRLLNDRN